MNLDLVRKARSPADVRDLISNKSMDDVARIIFSLAAVEQHYSPEEVADLEGMTAQTVRNDIKAGLFGGEYFSRNGKQIRVSASQIAAWRELFRKRVR